MQEADRPLRLFGKNSRLIEKEPWRAFLTHHLKQLKQVSSCLSRSNTYQSQELLFWHTLAALAIPFLSSPKPRIQKMRAPNIICNDIASHRQPLAFMASHDIFEHAEFFRGRIGIGLLERSDPTTHRWNHRGWDGSFFGKKHGTIHHHDTFSRKNKLAI